MATLKITEKSVAALGAPADAPQAYHWDTELAGFGVVVGKTGRKTFVMRSRPSGSRQLVKRTLGVLGQPREDGHCWTAMLARLEARKVLGQFAGGKVTPTRARASGPTLSQALEFHVERMERGENRRRKACAPGSIETLRGTVEYHLRDWLDEPLVRLDADRLDGIVERIEVEARRRSRAAGANPPGRATGVRLLANLSAIWNSWEKRHGLPVPNPVKRLTPAALKPRDERISAEGLPAWFATVNKLPPIRRDLQLVSLFSSIRRDGLRHLRHEDVDLDAGLLHITHAKGGKPYTLPLTQTLREIFERRKKDNAADPYFSPYGGDHGWVFPSISRDGKRVIPVAETKQRRAREDPQPGESASERVIPGTHVNRRTYNSIAMEAGVMKEFRDALLNHENRGVNVRHYGRPQTWDHLAAQAEIVERALWARLKPDPKAKAKRGRAKLRAV